MKTIVRELAKFTGGMRTDADGNAMPLICASVAYNYDFVRGALRDGIGLSEPDFGGRLPEPPVSAEGLWQYRRVEEGRRDDRIVLFGEGKLYGLSLYGERVWQPLGASFSACPTALNYRLDGEDVLILCSGADSMTVWNGKDSPRRVSDSPEIVSMCVHYERLWAVASDDRDCVFFSTDLDPTGWDLSLRGAGFISMPDERGQMLRVLSYLDDLYVFREYGITRITAYADQTQFSVAHLFTSSGAISGGTVCLCGDRVLFAASDGLYSFDGVETIRILSRVTDGLDATGGTAAFSEGKYYLSCRYDFRDGAGSVPVLLVYDAAEGDCEFFRGAEIRALVRIASGGHHGVAAVTAEGRLARLDRSGCVFGVPTHKVWTTPYTDLGRPDRDKALCSLTLFSSKPLTVFVCRDGRADRYELSGGECPSRIRLCGRARRLSVTFVSDWYDTYVSHPVLEYAV